MATDCNILKLMKKESQELKPKGETNSSFLVLHPLSGVHTVKTVGSYLKFISFNTWTPSISRLSVVILVVSTNSSPFRRLFPSQPLMVNNFPKNYRIYSCISRPFKTKKSTQKIALDLYTSHTQRPDQAVREISITTA